MVLNFAVYWMIARRLLSDGKLADWAARRLIDLNVLYAVVCIVFLVMHFSGLDPGSNLVETRQRGVYVGSGEADEIPLPRTLGTVTGSFLAAVCLVAAAKSFQRNEPHRRRLVLSAFIMLIVVIFSYARGAWLAVAIGVVIIVLSSVRSGRQTLRVTTLILLLTSLLGGTFFLMRSYLEFLPDVVSRRVILTVSSPDRGTAGDRWTYWTLFVNDAMQSPILGRGMDAYRVFTPRGMPAESFGVEVFHGAGAVGLGIYLLLNLSVVLEWLRFRASIGSDVLTWATPFLAGYAGLFVAMQTNPGAWGAFYWMFLAFLGISFRIKPVTQGVHSPWIGALHPRIAPQSSVN